MQLALVFLLLGLAGCADLSPQSRWQHADQLADKAGWQKLRIPTDKFILSAYVPKNSAQADTLTVYIEGDGLAWLTRSQASNDPTPRNPIALELALRHPQGMAVYLARPCQYVEASDAINCRQTYWTGGRFAPEVVETSNQAISALKQRVGADKLVLIGYSGGGAIAALVAARRNDVVRLITVAGNLDHRAWARMHHVPALEDSLNPVDEWQSLIDVPQRHFVGERDEIVSLDVADSYASRFPSDRRPEVITIPDFDHVCCWVENWGSTWLKERD
ncbi:MAG: alpha/beta hydrolase [Sulfuricella sp.]|nr:alpha/beta hydrolase [Sulfuricella sp.]